MGLEIWSQGGGEGVRERLTGREEKRKRVCRLCNTPGKEGHGKDRGVVGSRRNKKKTCLSTGMYSRGSATAEHIRNYEKGGGYDDRMFSLLWGGDACTFCRAEKRIPKTGGKIKKSKRRGNQTKRKYP